MFRIIAVSIYFFICLFTGISLYFINYHINKFGINPKLDNKITKSINITAIVLIIISFVLFILVPWESIAIKLL